MARYLSTVDADESLHDIILEYYRVLKRPKLRHLSRPCDELDFLFLDELQSWTLKTKMKLK